MARPNRSTAIHHLFRPALLITAAVASITFGACLREGTGALRQELSCSDYCAQAKMCNDGVNEDKCVDDCLETMGSCMADEQEAALDQLDECSNESCNNFVACTINAGATCVFGL